MSPEEFEMFCNALDKYCLKAETSNLFFTSATPLVGESADHSFLNEYIEKGMERAQKKGCEVAVIGSGKARRIPDGFDREKGISQFCEVLDISGNIAARYGVRIA